LGFFLLGNKKYPIPCPSPYQGERIKGNGSLKPKNKRSFLLVSSRLFGIGTQLRALPKGRELNEGKNQTTKE